MPSFAGSKLARHLYLFHILILCLEKKKEAAHRARVLSERLNCLLLKENVENFNLLYQSLSREKSNCGSPVNSLKLSTKLRSISTAGEQIFMKFRSFPARLNPLSGHDTVNNGDFGLRNDYRDRI